VTEAGEVRLVHTDERFAVVDKPAGLVVHPAPGTRGPTLVDELGPLLGGGPDAARPGIVHRLDRDTSGLMLVARDDEAHRRLSAAIKAREVSRTYLALVEGAPSAAGEIDAPVGRSPRHRKKMAVVAGGKEARTSYRRVETLRDTALLEVRPLTGRTHQIRVHLAAAGYPVVGDVVYGHDRKLAASLGLDRPFLHAWALAFAHPVTGEALALEEPLPEDLDRALALARGGPRTSR
jgi:23S rRNA pseudouridine1911/1915/1917 synthase